MPSIPGGKTQTMLIQQNQKPSQCCRCLHMMKKRRHGTGISMLPDMSSTILSWETSWNMGTKALIKDQSSITVEWHQV